MIILLLCSVFKEASVVRISCSCQFKISNWNPKIKNVSEERKQHECWKGIIFMYVPDRAWMCYLVPLR